MKICLVIMMEIKITFLLTNNKKSSSETVQMIDPRHVIFLKHEQIYTHLLIKLGETFGVFYIFS